MIFYTWTGTLGPDWNAFVPGPPPKSNWSGGAPGDIPRDSDVAVFDNGDSVTVNAGTLTAGAQEIQVVSGTTLTIDSPDFNAGFGNQGGLLVDDDGEVDLSSNGTLTGQGSLDIIGLTSAGTLVLQQGAAMDDTGMIVGADADASGEVSLDAATLEIAQSSATDGVLTVGEGGDGSIDISAGSMFYAATAILGKDDDSSGTISIEDSTWGGSTLAVGQGGTGELDVGAGAQVVYLTMTIGPDGDLSVSGSAASPGELVADFATLDFGTIDIAAGGALGVLTDPAATVSGAVVVGGALVGLGTINGNVVLNPGGSVQASLPVPGALTIHGNVSGSGTLAPLMTLEVNGGVDASVTIAFSASIGSAVGDLQLDVPQAELGTITGFGAGNTIDIQGSLYSAAIFTPGTADNAGTLTLSGGTAEPLMLAVRGDYTADSFLATPGETDTVVTFVACFLAGTHILTPTGEVPVQTLRPGDLVTTLSGAHRPLRWIGTGRTQVTPRNRDLATPIVVRKHALAEYKPHRDLYITRGHSLYLDGVLIPAEELVNHRSIAWADELREITYFHLELDSHDVVVAEGAAAETYREDGNSPAFLNVADRPAVPVSPPCAPVLHEHPIVKRVWRRLSDRAGRLDLAFTADPDLHLLADGVRVDAEATEASVWRFRLAGSVRDLRIVSRSAIPAMIGLDQDQRRLGVALRRIVFSDPDLRQEIAWDDTRLDEARLAPGFHQPEPMQRHRWTGGEATLPPPLAALLRPGAGIELHVAGLLPYPVEEQAPLA